MLFPNADHDDLFDGLQTMVEGAIDASSRAGFIFIDWPDPEPDLFGPYEWAGRYWGR